MPRHYRKPSDKVNRVKTYDEEMKKAEQPKKTPESKIFENYSNSKNDKEKKKKKINKK